MTSTAYPNGTAASYSYDNANRLIGMANRKSTNAVISSYAYTLDAAGNHLQEDRSEAISPVVTEGSELHAYDAENRLIDTNGVPNTFDANGNLSSRAIATCTTKKTA